MTKPSTLRPLHWLLLALCLLAASFLAQQCQRPISYNGGLGWDGVDYARMATQLAQGQTPQAQAPFVYRVGAPWLAALLAPDDPPRAFLLLNRICALLAPLLLATWLARRGLKAGTVVGLVLAFALPWHAPLRLTPFYPVHVDPLMWLFWLGALWLLEFSHHKPTGARSLWPWLLWILPAVAVREVLLLPALALAAQSSPLLLRRASLRHWWNHALQRLEMWRLLPVALGLACFAGIHSWSRPEQHYGFLSTALSWAWMKSPPHLAHGALLAFGPFILALLALGHAHWWPRLKERQDWLVWGMGVLVLGWLGGSDTERLLFWGAPFVLWGAGRAWEAWWPSLRHSGSRAWLWLMTGLLAQGLSMRLWWTIPDHPGSERLVLPLFSPLSSTGRYLDLWSQHARPEVQVLGLAEGLAMVLLLVGWAWKLKER